LLTGQRRLYVRLAPDLPQAMLLASTSSARLLCFFHF
jgi:hypothetical protein